MKTQHYITILLLLFALLITSFSNAFHLFLISNFSFSSVLGFFTPYILVFLCLTVSSILIFKYVQSILKKIAFISISVITCLSILFTLKPIYPEDFENQVTQINAQEYPIQVLDSISSAKTICFFLVSCPFCEIASRELNAHYLGGNISDIEFIYYSYENTADSLVASQNISIPYQNMETEDFFKLAGQSFPMIIQKNDDNSINYWSGNAVNYACIDYLNQK